MNNVEHVDAAGVQPIPMEFHGALIKQVSVATVVTTIHAPMECEFIVEKETISNLYDTVYTLHNYDRELKLQ